MVQSSLGGQVSAAFGVVPGFAYPTADAYVRKAIQTIGRESITSAYWYHGLEVCVSVRVHFFSFFFSFRTGM